MLNKIITTYGWNIITGKYKNLIPYLKPPLVNWLNILRREVKNFEGTRQNNSVTSEEGRPFRGDIKERGATVY